MMRKLCFVSAVSAIALAAACSKHSGTPTSPSSTTVARPGASADTNNLKVSAPTPVAPANGVKLNAGQPVVLVVNNASATYATGVALQYEFSVQDAGREIENFKVPAGPGTTRVTVDDSKFEAEKPYQWRARAILGDTAAGPWSGLSTFIAAQNGGYIRGTELYDPLTNGKTVGTVHGNVQFIPGVGAKLLDWNAYISYELPATLVEGEYSLIVTNMPANTKGGKQKVMAMAQGYSDIIENDRRMTVEKRGDPAGIVAWRFLTHDDRIETNGGERTYVNFQANLAYLFTTTWRGNFFNVKIQQDGASGPIVYQGGKNWQGRPYDPTPHVIYVGAPVGRSGAVAASIENTVYRNIWVSPNPRPAFANK
jgi:hypothetical protein